MNWNQPKSIKINQNRPKSNEINQNQPKFIKIKQNQPKSIKIDDQNRANQFPKCAKSPQDPSRAALKSSVFCFTTRGWPVSPQALSIRPPPGAVSKIHRIGILSFQLTIEPPGPPRIPPGALSWRTTRPIWSYKMHQNHPKSSKIKQNQIESKTIDQNLPKSSNINQSKSTKISQNQFNIN